MSGHSKWANIKRKKEKTDAQKGKIFTKLGRELAVTVRQGGPDPEANTRLKDVIAKAKAANMPNDTIMRSIKKAAGEADGTNYEEIIYEGYGPSGVAVIVEAMTDNRNRTASEMRHIFDKCGGNLGTSGSVTFMFDKKGVIIVEKEGTQEEEDFMMMVLEAGAEDISSEEEYYEIITSPEDFSKIRNELEKQGIKFSTAEIQMIPQNYVKLEEEFANKMELLIEKLEDNDDVENVYHNCQQEE